MSSSYPLHSDTPGTLCLRCGMTVSKNRYCTYCGYSNDLTQATISEQETQPSPVFSSTQTTISEQETQPSPVFPAPPEDLTLQPTQKLDQYYKQSQNLSPRSSQQPNSSVHSTSSATPFLGIDPDVSFPAYRSVQYIPSSGQGISSATPFLGIGSEVPLSPSPQPLSPVKVAPSVTPFLGTAPQSTSSQTDFKLSSDNESLQPLSSYSTQPTLIVPASLPKRQSSDESDLKQISQYKNVKRRVLIIISIIVLMIGGLAGYLFVYTPVIQKSVASTPSLKGPSEFVETFRNNSNQWDLRSETGKYSVTIADGSLILEDDNNSLLPEFLPGKRSFNNFKMMVDAVLSKGDQKNGYGLYIRCLPDRNGNLAAYYRFELYGDSTYAIFKGIVDKYGRADPSPRKLVSYVTSPAIQKQGDRNHIEVSAKGDTITIRVNGQALKTFSDTSYAEGTIALFISNIQNAPSGAQAKFSNLVIYPS